MNKNVWWDERQSEKKISDYCLELRSASHFEQRTTIKCRNVLFITIEKITQNTARNSDSAWEIERRKRSRMNCRALVHNPSFFFPLLDFSFLPLSLFQLLLANSQNLFTTLLSLSSLLVHLLLSHPRSDVVLSFRSTKEGSNLLPIPPSTWSLFGSYLRLSQLLSLSSLSILCALSLPHTH